MSVEVKKSRKWRVQNWTKNNALLKDISTDNALLKCITDRCCRKLGWPAWQRWVRAQSQWCHRGGLSVNQQWLVSRRHSLAWRGLLPQKALYLRRLRQSNEKGKKSQPKHCLVTFWHLPLLQQLKHATAVRPLSDSNRPNHHKEDLSPTKWLGKKIMHHFEVTWSLKMGYLDWFQVYKRRLEKVTEDSTKNASQKKEYRDSCGILLSSKELLDKWIILATNNVCKKENNRHVNDEVRTTFG